MFGGRIVEIAPVPRLLEEPLHPCTRGLVAAAAPGDFHGPGRGPWDPLPGDPPNPREAIPGCIFHRQCPHPEKDEECVEGPPDLESSSAGGRVACWKEIQGTDRA
jgi:peptide/nickel transport system ATP-binding protein